MKNDLVIYNQKILNFGNNRMLDTELFKNYKNN
jgi:hypothetical protein